MESTQQQPHPRVFYDLPAKLRAVPERRLLARRTSFHSLNPFGGESIHAQCHHGHPPQPRPGRFYETGVFDAPDTGLVKEPFVSGADTIIDRMVAELPNAERGFHLYFSATPFPGYQLELIWQREEYDGNWYCSDALDLEGWLCPALFQYFDKAPQRLFAQFRGCLKT